MPKKTRQTGTFEMKYGSRNYIRYSFALDWNAKVLRNKRAGPLRNWRTIDLAATTGCRVKREENIIVIYHRNIRGIIIPLEIKFPNADVFSTWVYWLLVSLITHSEAEIKDATLKDLGKGPGAIKETHRRKIRARRDIFAFDKRHQDFSKSRLNGFEDLPDRRMGADGRILGDSGTKYRSGRRFGKGGESQVFHGSYDVKQLICETLGLDPESSMTYWNPVEQPIVIKRPLPNRDIELVKEIRIHAALGEHKNIIRLIDVAAGPEGVYVILEKGRETLNEYTERENLSPEKCLKIALGVLHGVYHMHNRGIYHRDIKFENILVDDENIPKLIDFGGATEPSFSSLADFKIHKIGTAGYLPPETKVPLPNKKREVAERYEKKDSFAVGLTLLECLIGPKVTRGFKIITERAEETAGTYFFRKPVETKVSYWSEKVRAIRNRTLKDIGETSLKLCDLNYESRWTVKQAKDHWKRKYAALTRQVEDTPRGIQEAERRSRQVQKNVRIVLGETGSPPIPSRM
jgi:serine/threonine protein kinase